MVTRKRPALFRGRHFEDVIILLCVRRYLRYSLTYRDPEEIMAERGLSVDHATIWRWVQRFAPVLNQRIRRELRRPNRSWRVDETYVKVAGDWAYLYRAIDSAGETIEFMLSPERDLIGAKLFLCLSLSIGRRRIPDLKRLRREAKAWNRRMNRDRITIKREIRPQGRSS
jgi:transposase-like protein